jgi:hypothetical protein
MISHALIEAIQSNTASQFRIDNLMCLFPSVRPPMSQSALVDLINQAPKTHSEGFWTAFDSVVSSDEPLTGELDSKAKTKLIKIFRQSMSSPKPPVTIRIIISFIHKLSQSWRFVDNFGRSDPVLTSTFIHRAIQTIKSLM